MQHRGAFEKEVQGFRRYHSVRFERDWAPSTRRVRMSGFDEPLPFVGHILQVTARPRREIRNGVIVLAQGMTTDEG